MSTIAVINYGPRNDYAEMLPEHARSLHVFSHNPLSDTESFARYEHVQDCEFVPYAELEILRLARQHQVDYVITDNEYDLERVARIRQRLGIEGQSEASALSFRDKVVMKEVAGRTVRTPRFARLTTIVDLIEFIDEVSYPVVVKPTKQGGARDIVVLSGADELTEFSRRRWREDLMVEEFVDGDIYHVDAIVAPGYRFVASSRYLRTCLSVFSGQNNGSIQLHPRDELAGRLEDFLDRVLDAFDAPKVSAYHLEVFRTADDELLLCEIASRVGGSRIPAITAATYGLDLLTTWLRLSTDLPVDPAPSEPPEVLHGAVAIVPRGTAVTAPPSVPFPWVTRYEVNHAATPAAIAQNSTSHLCFAIVAGADFAEVEARLLTVESWLERNLVPIGQS
jgi:biotin carboxylase